MRVRFVGVEKRTNSFGTFMPKEGGRLYDVSNEVGEQLLTVPDLFTTENAPLPDKAKDRIIEVKDEDSSEYDGLNMKELRSLCRKRGVMLNRNMRKADIVELLKGSETEDVTGD
jgi:hypothetical protein